MARNTDGLTPFPKGVSGNPKGRPRKFVTQMKDAGYKASEVTDTLQALLACTDKELSHVISNDSSTMLELITAKALKKARKLGDLKPMETVLTRVFGYPKQSFEATIAEQPLFSDEDDPDFGVENPSDENQQSEQ